MNVGEKIVYKTVERDRVEFLIQVELNKWFWCVDLVISLYFVRI